MTMRSLETYHVAADKKVIDAGVSKPLRGLPHASSEL